MAVSLTGDVQQRAKASAAGRLLGTGASDLAPFPWRELTGAETQALLPPSVQLADEIGNVSGTRFIDPTATDTRFFSVTGSLTTHLTIDLSIVGQEPGPPIFIVWEGTNNSWKVIIETHSGEVVELTSTGWIVACYLDTVDPQGVCWRTMGRYKKNDEITGSKFARTVNTSTSITANAVLDQTFQLLRGTSAVAVSLAQTSGTNTQIVLVKETNQVITVSVGGAATYRLPGDDDGVTRTTSFVVTGTVTLIGDSGSWMVIGSTNHATTLFAALDANNFEVYGNLSPFQSASGSQAAADSGRSWNPTANLTSVPIANGWHATYVNVSGSSKTISPASGTCVKTDDATTAASVTLGNNKMCTVKGNGTNLIVMGDVT